MEFILIDRLEQKEYIVDSLDYSSRHIGSVTIIVDNVRGVKEVMTLYNIQLQKKLPGTIQPRYKLLIKD